MTKHTPGPWKVLKITGQDYGHRVISDTRDGAMLDLLIQLPDPDEESSDARLIAAAPELLEALYAALHGHKGWDDEARAAIAKATGGSP